MKDAYVVLGWLLITGVLNAALSRRTAEEWEALAERNPRYAAFAGFLRAIGLDPVKLMKSVVDILRGASQKHLGAASCLAAPTESACVTPKDEKPIEGPLKAEDDATEPLQPSREPFKLVFPPIDPAIIAAGAVVAPAEEPVAEPKSPAAQKTSSTSVKRNKAAKRKGKR